MSLAQIEDTKDSQEPTEASEMNAEQVAAVLDRIGNAATTLRHEAFTARKACGIEEIWKQDEDFYQGIDENNLDGEGSWDSKPPGQSMPQDEGAGSTVFANVTGPYCDIGAARMADMLLPTDEPTFSIEATPVPDLVKVSEGEIPNELLGQAEKLGKSADDLKSQSQDIIKQANDKAASAKQKITDWLVQCQYQAHVRAVLEDITRSGTGVLKGPIPQEKKALAFVDGEMVVQKELQPGSHRVDYWNCYPDLSCGENIHDGAYFWERDEITRKNLRELMSDENYFAYQINRVLQQGPREVTADYKSDSTYTERGLKQAKSKSTFEIWYGYVTLEKKELEGLGFELEENEYSVDVKITIVNNIVIQLARNLLDTGEYPYDFMVWKKRKNSPFGVGIARLIRTSQRIINAGVRALMDNSGLASGPMIVINQELVQPADGKWEVAPLKVWLADSDEEMDDASKAISYITIDMMQSDLQAIITLGLNLAEQVTGIPLILQGHTGNAPDTVGGMRMLQNNASTTLRRIARLFDDRLTEPHIRRYHAYLLQFGPDECKGDFQIDAKGSSALIERDIQNQSIMEMADVVTNPVFGIDPKKWIKELLASQRLDYANFEYDDERWQQIVEQMSQPQADPRLEIENMKALAKQQELEARAMLQERDNQFKLLLKEIESENRARIEAGKQELTLADMNRKHQEHIDNLNSTETIEMIKLKVQTELSKEKSAEDTPQITRPPSEPAGRAPNGQAFQR